MKSFTNAYSFLVHQYNLCLFDDYIRFLYLMKHNTAKKKNTQINPNYIVAHPENRIAKFDYYLQLWTHIMILLLLLFVEHTSIFPFTTHNKSNAICSTTRFSLYVYIYMPEIRHISAVASASLEPEQQALRRCRRRRWRKDPPARRSKDLRKYRKQHNQAYTRKPNHTQSVSIEFTVKSTSIPVELYIRTETT